MTEIQYVKGDATQPIGDGRKIIIHCCNDCVPGKWGKGFVMALSRRWKKPETEYRKWSRGHIPGLKFELGAVQFVKVEDDIVVGNMIGQKGIRGAAKVPPIRYAAIVSCLWKVQSAAEKNNASIHCCRFGAGLAGGDWNIIEGYLKDILCAKDISVTVYDL